MLSTQQIDFILRYIKTFSWQEIRNYTVGILMLDTGIRASELIGLNLKGVDWSELKILVMGTGSKAIGIED